MDGPMNTGWKLSPSSSGDGANSGSSSETDWNIEKLKALKAGDGEKKIKITRPVIMDGFAFTPYVSEEIFYDFRVGDFNQNRIAVGLSKEIGRNLGIGLYYMYKSNKKENSWSGANVLGTKFEIAF